MSTSPTVSCQQDYKEPMNISTSSTQSTIPYYYYYPRVEEFPFDIVCKKIVLALKARDWSFPGIRIGFSDLQDDNITYRRINVIESEDFRLVFRRNQGGKIGQHKDCAAISTINIPEKELSIYAKGLGPDFYVYVGKDWARDKKNFVYGQKCYEKGNNKPRTYLNYLGNSAKPGEEATDFPKVKPYLVATDDENEYSPQGNEPTYYKTNEIFQEFTAYLENILEKLQQQPLNQNIFSVNQKV